MTSKKTLTKESIDKYAEDENYKAENIYVLRRKHEMKTGHLQASEGYEDVLV